MAAILQMAFSKAFSKCLNVYILIVISLRFVPKGPIWKQVSTNPGNDLPSNKPFQAIT